MPEVAAQEVPSVLHVLTCDANAGTEIMVATLAERTDPRVVRSSVVTLDAPGPIHARLSAAGVPVAALGPGGFARAMLRLVALLRRERHDVVVTYGYRVGAIARFAVRLRRPRPAFVNAVRNLHIAEIANPEGKRARVLLLVERLTCRLVDAYDGNSRGALAILKHAGVPASRLHHIPNGIDLSEWSVPRRSTRDGPPLVACVARFAAHKRHRDLVSAIAQLRERGVEVRLTLAGDGPCLHEICALSTALGVADLVTLPGPLERPVVRALLEEADVFALVSTSEGMPGTVLEAMACGLPVVGTRVNGIADLVVDGETGRLVPLGDVAAIAGALEELARDQALREALGTAGRRVVEREYGLDRMVEAKQELYRSLAAGRAA